MVKLTWQPSAGQAFHAVHGRYHLSLFYNPANRIWFAVIYDARQQDAIGCLHDADVNVLRSEISHQIADLDILEAN